MVAEALRNLGRRLPLLIEQRPLSYVEAARIQGWPSSLLKLSTGPGGRWEDVAVDPNSCSVRLEFMCRCLVGTVGDSPVSVIEMQKVQQWVSRKWEVTAGVKVYNIHGALFLFKFPSCEEAKRILSRNDWMCEGEKGAGSVIDQQDSVHGKDQCGGMEVEIPVWAETGPCFTSINKLVNHGVATSMAEGRVTGASAMYWGEGREALAEERTDFLFGGGGLVAGQVSYGLRVSRQNLNFKQYRAGMKPRGWDEVSERGAFNVWARPKLGGCKGQGKTLFKDEQQAWYKPKKMGSQSQMGQGKLAHKVNGPKSIIEAQLSVQALMPAYQEDISWKGGKESKGKAVVMKEGRNPEEMQNNPYSYGGCGSKSAMDGESDSSDGICAK
ncbi:hypothetical protein F0562_010760 [Nyssa sinensis]|uniref:DUF4283 domain-containing protein n=1 Tax=Nyssa sinensis TaxID=561372 RepID=A0A5J5A4W4_9ASTE|nr:hypothetical protein F0562_010760 [Nyssa sinensis]